MSIDPEYAIKKDIRNNPIVREIDQEQKREFRRTLLIVGLFVLLLLLSAWPHSRLLSTGYQVEALRQELARELELNRQLRLEWETLRRPQEIERRAIGDLHMQRPTPDNTLIIERLPARSPESTRGIVAEAR
jgi:cell division protein FtsL